MRSGSSAQGGVYTENQLAGERLEGGGLSSPTAASYPSRLEHRGAGAPPHGESLQTSVPAPATPPHPAPPRPGQFLSVAAGNRQTLLGSRGPAPGHHAPLPRALHDTPTYPRGPGSPVSAGITLENSIVQQPKFINKRNPGLHWCFLRKDGTVQSRGTGQLHPAPLLPAPSPIPADAQAPRAA